MTTRHDTAPPRYIHYRLPEPAEEERYRASRRAARLLDALLCLALGIMLVSAVGLLVTEIDYGAFSTVVAATVMVLYAAFATAIILTGTPGLRYRYHRVTTANCALALEDAERKRFKYGSTSDRALDHVADEDVAEYLRLTELAEQLHHHQVQVRAQLSALTGEAPEPSSRE